MKVICTNKRATFEYFILEKYEAGIKLKGTEIKAIREGHCNINDAYVNIVILTNVNTVKHVPKNAIS